MLQLRPRCEWLMAATQILALLYVFVPPAAAQNRLTRSEIVAIDKLPKVPADLNGEYWIERRQVQTVKTKLTLEVNVPSLDAESWVFALAEFPSTGAQEVRTSTTVPTSTRIPDRSPLSRTILYSKFRADSAQLKHAASIQAESEVVLYSRSLRSGKSSTSGSSDVATVELLSDANRKIFLRPNKECEYSSKVFRDWKAKNEFARKEDEGEIQFARRVYQSLVRSYQYLYVPDQDRTAAALCKTNKTDCGGLSILFVTVMRSEGIPARVLAGRWAKSANEGETIDGQRYHQYHVIAEFYASNVGWVPLDASSAILHDESPEKLQFFGQDRGNFVVMHVDTGIDFDSGLFGNYQYAFLQIPVFWVRGSGKLKDKVIEESWVVETVSSNNGT